jgi:hypothetical protein
MNAQVHTRHIVDQRPHSPAKNAAHAKRRDHKPIAPLIEQETTTTPEEHSHVDPLWMITVAGALMFAFLAIAAALG